MKEVSEVQQSLLDTLPAPPSGGWVWGYSPRSSEKNKTKPQTKRKLKATHPLFVSLLLMVFLQPLVS